MVALVAIAATMPVPVPGLAVYPPMPTAAIFSLDIRRLLPRLAQEIIDPTARLIIHHLLSMEHQSRSAENRSIVLTTSEVQSLNAGQMTRVRTNVRHRADESRMATRKTCNAHLEVPTTWSPVTLSNLVHPWSAPLPWRDRVIGTLASRTSCCSTLPFACNHSTRTRLYTNLEASYAPFLITF